MVDISRGKEYQPAIASRSKRQSRVIMANEAYKVHQEKLTSINQAPDSMVSNADALNPQQLELRAYFVEPSRNIGLCKVNRKKTCISYVSYVDH